MIKSIVFNSGSNLAAVAVRMVITFFLAPILIKNLGNYDYGIWEMTVAIIGYMGILDLGLKPAVSRFTALYQGKKEPENSRLLFSSALAYMGLIGILLCSLALYYSFNWAHLLSPEGASDTEKYSLFCLIIGIQLLFAFPGYVAESTLEGLQRYYIKNILSITISITSFFILKYNITPDNALILLITLNTLGVTIKYAIYFVILRMYGTPKLSPFGKKPSFSMIKKLFVFGGKSLIQGISHRVETATDTLVIGFIMGPAMVPFYSIPANLVSYVQTIAMNISHVFMPIFSDLKGQNTEINRVKGLYLNASRVIVSIVLLLAIGVLFYGESFISLWMGAEYGKDSVLLISILLAFVLTPLLNPLASRYLTSIDKHSIFAKLSPISASINIGLTIPLVYSYGILGAAMGSLIPVAFFQYVYFRKCLLELKLTALQYLAGVILPSLTPLAVTASLFYYIQVEYNIDSFTFLFSTAMLGSIVYLSLYLLLNRKLPECQKVFSLVRQTR